VLVVYVHHIGNALKVDAIIESIGEETRELLDKLYTPKSPETPDGYVAAERPGIIFRVDEEALVEAARDADVLLEMTHGVGQFVPEGAPLLLVAGDPAALDLRRVHKAVALGPERTMDQDGAFGVQTLVDIAERALTENFNDQTTAAQAVDRLHDIMRQLATRSFPSGRHTDVSGTLRLIVPSFGWEDYVAIAFDSLLQASRDAPGVSRRIRAALEDIAQVAPADRRPAVEKRLELATG
jgi:uncharacterized membrane protein